MPVTATPLLSADEPAAYAVQHRAGRDFLVVCDHASARIPKRLDSLGLSADTLATHIAVDIGALATARRIAALLDATLVSASYSRLVIDCNRYPWDPASVAKRSGGIDVPGNAAVDEAGKLERVRGIFLPYQREIARELATLRAHGGRPTLLSIHSCTPVLDGPPRPWPVGVSYVEPAGRSRALIAALAASGVAPVGDNEPYTLEPGEDYTVPEHALRAGLEYVQVEFRQDVVGDEAGAHHWAEIFVAALHAARRHAPPPAPTPWTPAWGPVHDRAADASLLNIP